MIKVNAEINKLTKNIQTEINILDQDIQTDIRTLREDIQVDLKEGIIYAFSPIAKVEQKDGQYIITITDKNGTTTANFFAVSKEEIVEIMKDWMSQHILVLGVKGDNEEEYRHGNINITKQDIGLSNVDNTSDIDKPISRATQLILNQKSNILIKTIQEWRRQINLVSSKNTIYVYSNYKTKEDENGNIINIPSIKIGDGQAYVVDLPFVEMNDQLDQHILDTSLHVTQAEKDFWNNKVTATLSKIEEQQLIFTKN